MRESRRRILVLALLVPLALTLSARAQDGDAARSLVRALEHQLFFVEKFDRSYGELATRLTKERAARPGAAVLAELHQRVLLSWARSLEKRGDPAGALARYDSVCEEGAGAKSFQEAAEASARLCRRLAENADSKSQALTLLKKARDRYLSLGNEAEAQALYGRIVDLLSEEGLAAYKKRDYARAYEILSELAKQQPGGLGDGAAGRALADLQKNTGVLTVGTIPVKASGTPIATEARIVLTPKGTGERAEFPARGKHRLRTGNYGLDLFVAGNSKSLLSLPVPLGSRGAEVMLPEKVPHGMVYIPPSAGLGSFFIDRTEVTVAEFKRAVPGYRPRHAGNTLPAHGISFTQAKQYASEVRKHLPTLKQWTRAAFAGASSPYPWGRLDPDGRCNIGTGKPSVVGSYPQGRSPYGVEDMAGNVWEWLRSGEAIGGGFKRKMLSFQNTGWRADALRDPRPDESVYRRGTPEYRRKYRQYRIVGASLVEVGLRCVIELR